MALSLLYNPVDYSSAHGDLIFTLLEDTKPFASSTYPDYKYVCDIYIGGVLVARLKAFPRPNDKIGFFNIGNVVRNYILGTFGPAINNLLAQKIGENNFYINVICRFGEEYGGVTYTNIIIDSQRSYFNHYNGRLIGQLTILPNYLDKVMSTRPYATPVTRDAQYNFIPFLPTDDTTINLNIKSYNGNALVNTTTQPFTPTALSTNELQQFNVAPAAINAAVPGFISSNITHYTVEFNTTNITGDSIYRFNIVCEPKYETYTVHFLNRFGGYESRYFTKVSRRKIEIEKKDIGTPGYSIQSDGTPLYFNSAKAYQETRAVYSSSWKEKLTLNTDILTDAEYAWLEDMILSPIVLIEIEDYIYPVVISDNNYEPRKVINDDLTNLTINIEFGDRFNTQYR